MICTLSFPPFFAPLLFVPLAAANALFRRGRRHYAYMLCCSQPAACASGAGHGSSYRKSRPGVSHGNSGFYSSNECNMCVLHGRGQNFVFYTTRAWVAWWRNGYRALDFQLTGRGFKSYLGQSCVTTSGKLFTPVCLYDQAV